jgi:hypothetical protein
LCIWKPLLSEAHLFDTSQKQFHLMRKPPARGPQNNL